MEELTAVTTTTRSVWRPVVLAVLLIGLLAGGGHLAWVTWGSVGPARSRAAQEVAELRQRWAAGQQTPSQGNAAWILRIPELDAASEWPVRAGVAPDQLDGGFGWYPGTSRPGEVGNFAVAGRWLTGGEPLRGWFELKVGTKVEVETAEAVLTYELTSAPGELTVGRDRTWVLDPVPGREDVIPRQALLTLTTNEDLLPGPDVSVAFGVLTGTELK